MRNQLRKVRFALFTKSYAGWYLSQKIKLSKERDYMIKNLAKALLFQEKHLLCFILHKTCQRKFSKIAATISKTNERISVYLRIEKELIFLTQEKENKNRLITEDYENALLFPAIERVTGDNLRDVNNDHQFEKQLVELEREYKHWYYKIVYQYKLPTLRIIPFLLRMITDKSIIHKS